MLTYFKTWIKVVLYAYNGYTNHLADSVQLMLIMSGPDCEPRWGTHTSSYTSRKLSMFRETQKFLLVNYPGRESLVYLPLWWIKLIVITVAMKTRDVLTALESAKIFFGRRVCPGPAGELVTLPDPLSGGKRDIPRYFLPHWRLYHQYLRCVSVRQLLNRDCTSGRC